MQYTNVTIVVELNDHSDFVTFDVDMKPIKLKQDLLEIYENYKRQPHSYPPGFIDGLIGM